MIFVYIKS